MHSQNWPHELHRAYALANSALRGFILQVTWDAAVGDYAVAGCRWLIWAERQELASEAMEILRNVGAE